MGGKLQSCVVRPRGCLEDEAVGLCAPAPLAFPRKTKSIQVQSVRIVRGICMSEHTMHLDVRTDQTSSRNCIFLKYQMHHLTLAQDRSRQVGLGRIIRPILSQDWRSVSISQPGLVSHTISTQPNLRNPPLKTQ